MKVKIIFLLLACFLFTNLDGKKKKLPPLAMQKVNYTIDKDMFFENAKVCIRNIFHKEKKEHLVIYQDYESDELYVLYRKKVVCIIKMPARLVNQKKRIAKLERKMVGE